MKCLEQLNERAGEAAYVHEDPQSLPVDSRVCLFNVIKA